MYTHICIYRERDMCIYTLDVYIYIYIYMCIYMCISLSLGVGSLCVTPN